MGTAAPAVIAAAALAVASSAVGVRGAADPCTGVTPDGGRFATCFDPGNRLVVDGGTTGFAGGISIRHTLDFEDDPDLIWKLDHSILDVGHGLDDGEWTGTIYRGRFLRHSRDGHIVLPIGSTPRKIFLPFDLGGLVEVGRLWTSPTSRSDLQVVETALLFDFARTRDFRTRFAFGPVASWDVSVDHDTTMVVDQRVMPMSAVLAEIHLETRSGQTLLDLRGETGTAWHTTSGWAPRVRGEAALEHVVFAVNDRPVALYGNAVYDSDSGEAIAGVGLRASILQRTDPRVRLHPLLATAAP